MSLEDEAEAAALQASPARADRGWPKLDLAGFVLASFVRSLILYRPVQFGFQEPRCSLLQERRRNECPPPKVFCGEVANHVAGDRPMPDETSSKLDRAKLSEKQAWLRYAGAKDDNWQEAFAEWVEARDASLAAWAEEVSGRRR